MTDKPKASPTKRPVSDGVEEILGAEAPVLDHGFVRVVDYMGNDGAIVQAARVSYGAGAGIASRDRGLIRYLMRNRHTSPFEMCELKLHVKCPIFVARQWLRHRMASVNEQSARYSILSGEFYIPEPGRVAAQSAVNHQGSGAALPPERAREVLDILGADARRCYDSYERMLAEDGLGVARELARMNLTLNTYTQFYWKIDLHNLLHFLSLRADRHSQYEIRAFAETILGIVEKWVPLAFEAFKDYRAGSFLLSSGMLDVLRRKLGGEAVSREEGGLSGREWRELEDALGVEL